MTITTKFCFRTTSIFNLSQRSPLKCASWRLVIYLQMTLVFMCLMHVMAMFFQHYSSLLTIEVFNWATKKFMTIHPQKTKYMIITTWQKHKKIPLSNVPITINKEPIERVSHIKCLGVIVDNNLSWAYHIKEITSKMAKSTYQLARMKNFIDQRCRKTFYHAYIHNKLEYGILLFVGAAVHQLRPLNPYRREQLN